MKRILITLICLFLAAGMYAQSEGVSINQTGADPDASAILDVQSSNKGLLIPRMDSSSRKAILNPAEGLMVYDSTTLSFWYFRNLSWTELAPGKDLRDADGDTRLEVERTADEDRIRMTADGAERFRVDGSGIVSTGAHDYNYVGAFPDSGAGTRLMWVPGKMAFRVGAAIGNEWDPQNVGLGSSVAGGQENLASGAFSFIGTGENNQATAYATFVGNGDSNKATGSQSTVLNGESNLASARYATVLGGVIDTASGSSAIVGAGYRNTASGANAALMGGNDNRASGLNTFIGSGRFNYTSGQYTSIVGGSKNIATGDSAFLGGGAYNHASGGLSSVSGGYENSAIGLGSAVVGGQYNNATGENSFMGGGRNNLAQGKEATVAGGLGNQALGRYTSVPGGLYNYAPSYGETVVGINSATYTPHSDTSYHPEDRIFSVGNGQGGFDRTNALTILKSGRVGIGTTSPDVSALMDLTSPNQGILIPRMSSSNRLAIPNPAEGLMVYDSTTNNFQYFSNGSWNPITGSGGAPTDRIQDSDADTRIEVEQSPDEDRIRLLTRGQERLLVDTTGFVSAGTFVQNYGGVLPDSGAGTRMMWLPVKGAFRVGGTIGPEWNQHLLGNYSTVTGGLGNIASGQLATIAGGQTNNAPASNAAVLGGYRNRAAGDYSSVAGGSENLASHTFAHVAGGGANMASGYASFAGGFQDTAYGYTSVVVGGHLNRAFAQATFVGGGENNRASGTYSVVVGGNGNVASGNQSSVGGGFQNTASGTLANVAGGVNNVSSGQFAFIGGGILNQVSGASSTIAGGEQNIVTGDYNSVGGGANNTASGTGSTVLGGRQSHARGDGAIAGGLYTDAHSYGEISLGLYPETYTPASPTSFNAADRLLAIGNGTSTLGRSNALTLLKNGNLGLGTSSPDTTLHVVGKLKYEDGTQQAGYILTADAQGVASWQASGDTIWRKTANGAIYAMNAGNTVTGANSLVAGLNNTVHGFRSLAVGEGNLLEDPYSYAFGSGNRMLEGPGFVFGFSDTLTFNAGTSFILGQNSVIRSPISGAFGDYNRILSSFGPSYAFGISNTISGNAALAMGRGLRVEGDYEMVLGRYNELYTPTGWDTDRLFTIANGTPGTSSTPAVRSNALTILRNGSMGLGTTTPQSRLDVEGGMAVGATYSGSTAAPANGAIIEGSVGIGTTNPIRGRLEVVGTGQLQTNLAFAFLDYLNGGIITGDGTYDRSYSIWATDNIAATEFHAISDRRVKNIIGRSDASTDLQTLMDIQITDYTFKDTLTKGSKPMKKVIAQEVAEIFPQAVNATTTEVVPDIYQRADVQDGWIMLTTDLQPGERVKLITEEGNEVHEVLAVEANRFQVSGLAFRSETVSPLASHLFVYGREVSDFHTVDYEALSMLNVSATQAQQRRIEALESENAALKAQVQRLQSLEARLQALEAVVVQP